jgi:hypothetical protein
MFLNILLVARTFFSFAVRRKKKGTMATLEALLQQLTAASHVSIQDPRTVRQQEQCVACGARPSDLRDMREREQKTHNIYAGQRRLVEMYGQDCQLLTGKLSAANDSLERQHREMDSLKKELADKDARLSVFEAQRAQFEADVDRLKNSMAELEHARSALESCAVGTKRKRGTV